MKTTVSATDMEIEVEADRFVTETTTFGGAQLIMVSFVASESHAKAVIAAMHSKQRVHFNLAGKLVTLHEAGYLVQRHKLPKFNAVHVVARAKDLTVAFYDLEGGDSAEINAVRRYLLSPQITSPIVEEWVPAVVAELQRIHSIKRLKGHGIGAYKFVFDSKAVDVVLTRLLKSGKISVPGSNTRKCDHASNEFVGVS
jgi:hypothetical protein